MINKCQLVMATGGTVAQDLTMQWSALSRFMQDLSLMIINEVSLAQVLRADREAWLHIAEKITSLKRNEHGKLPLEEELSKVLAHPAVS